MPIGYSELPLLLPVPGVRLAAVAAGIRYRDRKDLVVIELAETSRGAAVFTRNAFCAAPVTIARHHLSLQPPRFMLINSGNANAGTGDSGMQAARRSSEMLAEAAACRPEQVLPFSTGVIGVPLPMEVIEAAIPRAVAALSADGGGDAGAEGIERRHSVRAGRRQRRHRGAGGFIRSD